MSKFLTELMRGSEKCTIAEDFQHDMWVADMKEIYCREECLRMGITPEEYNRITASTGHADSRRHAQDAASLANQIVGCDYR